MKKGKVVMLVLVFVLCVFSNTYLQDCGYDYGKNIGSHRGVIAYSNGSCTWSGEGDYQCTEYVLRFYQFIFQFKGKFGIQKASEMFGVAQSRNDFLAFKNNGTVPPKQGMILCYGGGKYDYGHVAIITRVDLKAKVIDIIDQNRHIKYPYFKNIPIAISNGKYLVSSKWLGSEYYTQGWVGLKYSFPTPNPPILGTNRTTLNFGTMSTRQMFNIRNAGYGTLTWSISDNKDWINVNPTNGTGNRTIIVDVNRNSLLYGSHVGYLCS